jgi:hypothetical protein
MKWKIIIGIASLAVILILILTYFIYFEPRSWGEEGDLSLEIILDNDEIDINGTINLDYILTNTGKTDLRIIYPFYAYIQIFNSNNISIDMYEVYEPPAPPKNDDLHVLKAGKSKHFQDEINEYSWNIESNETYRVIGSYTEVKHDDITLPYWKGSIQSNELYFKVI